MEATSGKKRQRRTTRSSSRKNDDEQDTAAETTEDAGVRFDEHNCTFKDAIMGTSLNKDSKHFFWTNPSGNTFCYSLKTLVNVYKMNGSNHWKEPPVFRTAASEVTIARMEKIFGKEALSIHSVPEELKEDRFESNEWAIRYGEYIRNAYTLVPGIDLYTCPICYYFSAELIDEQGEAIDDINLNEMELIEEKNEENENEFDNESGSKSGRSDDPDDEIDIDKLDPLATICPSLGTGEYEVNFPESVKSGGRFCFRYKNDLVTHIAEVHGIRSKKLKGKLYKEFFENYKMKGQDGLIQRFWVHKNKGDNVQTYWSSGGLDRPHFYGAVVAEVCLNIGISNNSLDSLPFARLGEQEFRKKSKDIWEMLTANVIADEDEGQSDIDFIADDDMEVKVYKHRHKILPSDSDSSSEASLEATKDLVDYYNKKYGGKNDKVLEAPKRKRSPSSESSASSELDPMESYRRDLAKRNAGKNKIVSKLEGEKKSQEGLSKQISTVQEEKKKLRKAKKPVIESSSDESEAEIRTPAKSQNTSKSPSSATRVINDSSSDESGVGTDFNKSDRQQKPNVPSMLSDDSDLDKVKSTRSKISGSNAGSLQDESSSDDMNKTLKHRKGRLKPMRKSWSSSSEESGRRNRGPPKKSSPAQGINRNLKRQRKEEVYSHSKELKRARRRKKSAYVDSDEDMRNFIVSSSASEVSELSEREEIKRLRKQARSINVDIENPTRNLRTRKARSESSATRNTHGGNGFIEISAPKTRQNRTFDDGGDGEFEFGAVPTHQTAANDTYESEKEFGEAPDNHKPKVTTDPSPRRRVNVVTDSSSEDDEVTVRQKKLNENDIYVPSIEVKAAASDSSESDSDEG